MKQLLLGIGMILMISTHAQNTWERRDSVNGPPRGAATAFVLGDDVFVVGGVNVEEFKRKMYSYDIDQDNWDDEVALGGPSGTGLERASAISFSALGYGYVGLGTGSAEYMNDLWRYDRETETWTQMADFEGTPRRGAVAFAVDNVGFVGSGQDSDGLTNDFYRYDAMTNTWSEIASLDGERREAVGFTMGGKGYVGTGRGATQYYKDFWEYNPLTDEWTEKAELPGSARMGAVGCGAFPNAYIMLGEGSDFAYRDDVWEYNYFGDIWTERASYTGGPRTQATAAVIENSVFVGLGFDGTYHDDFYQFIRVLDDETETVPLFNLYPNPVSTSFTIQLNTTETYTLCLYDQAGRDVTTTLSSAVIKDKALIELRSPLPEGIYHLSFFQEGIFVSSRKLVIQ